MGYKSKIRLVGPTYAKTSENPITFNKDNTATLQNSFPTNKNNENQDSFAFVYNTALSNADKFQTMPTGAYPIEEAESAPNSLVAPTGRHEHEQFYNQQNGIFPSQKQGNPAIPSRFFPEQRFPSQQGQRNPSFQRQQEVNPFFQGQQGQRNPAFPGQQQQI